MDNTIDIRELLGSLGGRQQPGVDDMLKAGGMPRPGAAPPPRVARCLPPPGAGGLDLTLRGLRGSPGPRASPGARLATGTAGDLMVGRATTATRISWEGATTMLTSEFIRRVRQMAVAERRPGLDRRRDSREEGTLACERFVGVIANASGILAQREKWLFGLGPAYYRLPPRLSRA
jgi:hypothetical protein